MQKLVHNPARALPRRLPLPPSGPASSNACATSLQRAAFLVTGVLLKHMHAARPRISIFSAHRSRRGKLPFIESAITRKSSARLRHGAPFGPSPRERAGPMERGRCPGRDRPVGLRPVAAHNALARSTPQSCPISGERRRNAALSRRQNRPSSA